MSKVTIEVEVTDALIALGPIQDKMLESQRLAAIATGDEREIAQLSARMLGRFYTAVTDALYPDPAQPIVAVLQ